MTIRIIPFSYCRGVEYPEDLLILCHRNDGSVDVGVGDGVDAFHSPDVPRHLVEGFSRAQWQCRNLLRCFNEAANGLSLDQIINNAIGSLRQWATQIGIPLDRPDDLPGIDVTVARIPRYAEEVISLIQMGDTLAFWEYQLGGVSGTPNQAKEFEMAKGPEFKRIEQQYGTAEAWNKIEPTFRAARRKYTNTKVDGAYATMNGQPGAAMVWDHRTFKMHDLSLLLCMTDGLFNEDESFEDHQALAEKMIRLYREGGWQAIFEAKGSPEHGEGTGIAVEF